MIFVHTKERVAQCEAGHTLGAMQTHTTSAAIQSVLAHEERRVKNTAALGLAPQAMASSFATGFELLGGKASL